MIGGDDVDRARALALHRVGPAIDGRHVEDDRVHGVVGQRDDDRNGGRVFGSADELLIVDDVRAFVRRLLQPVRLRDREVGRQLDVEIRLDRDVVGERRVHAFARIGVARRDHRKVKG